MKLIQCVLPSLIVCAAFLRPDANAATWLTDLTAAQAKAKAEEKMVLINFTASDRGKWCIQLNQEVFSQPEFDAFASNNLILVEVDFRNGQNAALLRTNETLAEKFRVQGYPTLIVLNSQGQKTATLGYVEGGPASFIAALARNPVGKFRLPAESKTAPEQTASSKPAPRPENAATPAPAGFSELTLKGISGPKDNRLAMINNRTLAAGESTTIRLRDRPVKIRCVEILEKSVIVTMDDSEERREVRLRDAP
jgi:thioredoxin-related protein